MDNTIFGIQKNTLYFVLGLLLLITLGILSLHYYAYFSATKVGGLEGGIGAGFALFPSTSYEKLF